MSFENAFGEKIKEQPKVGGKLGEQVPGRKEGTRWMDLHTDEEILKYVEEQEAMLREELGQWERNRTARPDASARDAGTFQRAMEEARGRYEDDIMELSKTERGKSILARLHGEEKTSESPEEEEESPDRRAAA